MNLRSGKLVSYAASKKKGNVLHKTKRKLVTKLSSKSLQTKESKSKNEILNIFIKIYTGQIISLTVHDNLEIGSLKLKVEKLEEIPERYQRIVFCETELQDNRSLNFYDIRTGSTLLCQAAVLLICAPMGKIFELAVNHEDTVKSIKEKLQIETNISTDLQRLFYPCCSYRGRQLEDTKSITENGLEGNLVHLLESCGSMEVYIEVMDTVRKIINFKVKDGDTIQDIKFQIEIITGIATEKQSLFYFDNYLDNVKTYQSYGFRSGTVLQMCEGEMIFVKVYSGEKFPLYHISKHSSIRNIKYRIRHAALYYLKSLHCFHDDAEKYRLYFHGRLLEDNKIIADYNIGYGMKIEVYFGKRFYIFSSLRSKLPLEVRHVETIKSIKKKLQAILVYPVANQTIIFLEKELKNNVAMEEIEEFANLYLIIKTGNDVSINVIFENYRILLNIDDEFTVEMIKLMVEEKLKDLGSAHALDKCMLFCDGQEEPLPLSEKLSEIPNFSRAIFKVLPTPGAFFVTVEGIRSCKFSVTYSTTVWDLKEAIRRFYGIPTMFQRLLLNNWGSVSYDDTIGTAGIRKGDIIKLYIQQVGC